MSHTVLIVDDSEFVRQSLKDVLRGDGDLDVVEARNGKEALDILDKRGDVAAIVLDVAMPILDGKGVLDQLVSEDGHAPFVVAIGARDDQQALDDCLKLGADKILTKPLDMETLRSLLRDGIAARELRQAH